MAGGDSGDRVLRRRSVFLPDPQAGRSVRFVAGDVIPERFKVGDHLFRDGPDWSGHPQRGKAALRSTRPVVPASQVATEAEPAQAPPADPSTGGAADTPGAPSVPAAAKKATRKRATKKAATKKAPARKSTAKKATGR